MSANPWRALDLDVLRRIDGLVPGDHEGSRLGLGSEREEVVRYQPGDDVRRIDWNITARSTDLHVWRPRADNQLDTWVLLDITASMAFGTVADEKHELAAKIVAAVGLLTDAPGNRLGVATFGADGVRWHRPDSSRLAAHRLTRELAGDDRRTGSGITLAAAIDEFGRRRHRQGLRIVVSDFFDPAGGFDPPFDWYRPLRRLAARHDVIAIEVVDPREMALPDVGSVLLVDPESGRQRQIWTSNRTVRRRYEDAAAAYRTSVSAAIRSSGAEHLPVSTGRDWVRDLARFIAARRRTMRRRSRGTRAR
ncbi:DUF58 domain-containing protein [Mycolicibacterium wolinskyi]|uniref:DUF58 domain-containing protein n=1 Tax=Mycolicibacterium wolinskyi TaxID=59750 RepID=A0A1X2FEA2_9MYCO|nr:MULTISPECIES: DUF58 domain-containing protein [Mycolicibacterium]MCV7284561.1 DUF58 domain-containing protein [Mycolicibacterium wolinskyi]MCV7291946.1 DUF58 domain-containing protein [Mycolicibacterium goodii]ORX16638.1 hypothetical protein AWC31_21720 [Mycolicibacterium wolinskyi]